MIRKNLDYINDIIDSIASIERFINDIDFDNFKNDEKTIYAVIRALEIIGESAKNISEDIKKKHTEIPWKNISGTRDKLIHEYFGVNKNVVWDTIKKDLPDLKEKIEKLRDIYEEK
ncbi:DUF86 domain-containing protein [Patescibacteria group bacterium]|nr:DUF86 domain-containing protein [Patescibacteria group bacterium]